jgi:Ca-activated chloride channel family protein
MKKMGRVAFLIFTFSCSLIFQAVAQTADRQYIRQGNRLYNQGNFADAEVSYRKALEANDRNPQALYNLGNALLSQFKDSAAVEQFEKAVKVETNALRKSKSYHNMGVICQRHQMYGEAIEAYKNSLRLNPDDDETRYNLALCKHMLKKQPPQQDQQKQDQQKQNNQQDEKKKQEEKSKQEEQKKEQPQMSKENAEQLLNAAMQNEKRTMERMQKEQQTPQRRTLEKNW